jgi:2TM domain-containing protein
MEKFENTDELRYERAKKRVQAISGFYRHLGVYMIVNLVLLAIKFFTRDAHEPWELGDFSTAFFWGIGLAFHAFGVFWKNIFLGGDWEERKIRQIMDKEKSQKWE